MNLLLDRNAEEITILPKGKAKEIEAILKKHHISPTQSVQINFGEPKKRAKNLTFFK